MLRWLNVAFHAVPADVDETPRSGEAPATLTARLARAKALAARPVPPRDPVLAADTIVALQDESLGKPRDAADARSMLRRLQKAPHAVHTTVTLYDPARDRLYARHVTTNVTMRPYSEAEIQAYIASGNPLDKAGGYAIQHPGFAPVARVDRCYANVMGLPLCAVVALLRHVDCNLSLNLRRLCLDKFRYACPGTDKGERL